MRCASTAEESGGRGKTFIGWRENLEGRSPSVFCAPAPIPPAARGFEGRDEWASHPAFDSLHVRSKPRVHVVRPGSATHPSPRGYLRPADPARGDLSHPRRHLPIRRGLARRAPPRKVKIENLRQLENDGHPGFPTRARDHLVRGLVTLARTEPGVVEKCEKSSGAPDYGHSVIERSSFPFVSRIELAHELTTRLRTPDVDRAVTIRVTLDERGTRERERVAVRNDGQVKAPRQRKLARQETSASEEGAVAAQSARLAQRGELGSSRFTAGRHRRDIVALRSDERQGDPRAQPARCNSVRGGAEGWQVAPTIVCRCDGALPRPR